MRILPTWLASALVLATGSGASPVLAENASVPARALRWLERNLEADAGATTEINASVEGKRLSALFVAGYLLEMHPEVDASDAFRERIDAAASEFLAGRTTGQFQATWLEGFLALYLAEAQLRGKDRMRDLERLAAACEAGQNVEGGWCHGKSGIASFYPSTLMAATNWAVLALGVARRLGVAVDDAILARALELYADVQSPSGAFPYGGRNYVKGFEAGRTAAAVAALAALGEVKGDLFRRAVGYAIEHAEEVPDGHASAAMHILTGALCFGLLGEPIWERFERTVLARVTGAQREDGSFDDILGRSPDSLELMGSATLNRAYITALYAASLAARSSLVVEQLSLSGVQVEEAARAPTAPPPAPPPLAWRRQSKSAEFLAAGCGTVVLGGGDGTLEVVEGTTGERRASLAARDDRLRLAALFIADGRVVSFWMESGSDTELPASMQALLERGAGTPGKAICHSLPGLERIWEAEFPGLPFSAAAAGERLVVLLRSGALIAIHLDRGNIEPLGETMAPVVNGGLAPDGERGLVVASEARLRVLGGAHRWEHESAGKRGLSPAAFSSVAWWRGDVIAGLTSGRLQLRSGNDGRVLWRRDLGGGAVVAVAAAAERALAVTADGALHATKPDGSSSWRFAPAAAKDSHAPPVVQWDGTRIWLDHGAGTFLYGVDPETGSVSAQVPVPAQSPWAIDGGVLFVCSGGELGAYRVGP